MTARALIPLALLAASCSSLRLEMPPIERSGPESHVRAWNAADADRVAAAMERLVPRVREWKGVVKPTPLVILSREHLPGLAVAAKTPTFLVLDPDSLAEEGWHLAHELTHWYGDATWDRLPYALDEGLADHVASIVEPVQGAKELELRYFHTPEVLDRESFQLACAPRSEDPIERPLDETDVRQRAIGLAAVSAIGIPALRALCERAGREGLDMVPAEWVWDALPFRGEEPGSWRAAIARRMMQLDVDAERVRAGSATDAASESARRSR